MSRYFDKLEFRCKCGRIECDAIPPTHELLLNLNTLRARFKNPLIISSGSRCSFWNTKSGGNKNSAHLDGMAVDIRCLNSSDRFALIECNFRQPVLFRRIGIDKLFIHFDCSPNLAPEVFWLYA